MPGPRCNTNINWSMGSCSLLSSHKVSPRGNCQHLIPYTKIAPQSHAATWLSEPSVNYSSHRHGTDGPPSPWLARPDRSTTRRTNNASDHPGASLLDEDIKYFASYTREDAVTVYLLSKHS